MKFFNNKKILITGGAGFIGSHLTKKLLQLGCPKINLFVRNTNIRVKTFYKVNNYEFQDSQVYGKRLIKDD